MAVTVTQPVRRRPVFYALRVSALDRLTEDSLAITFAVPPGLRETFAFRAGQHLTVRHTDADTGRDVRRSYSICSTPAELAARGRLSIGVKAIPGGSFSAYAASALHTGDAIDVLPPLGSFTSTFDPDRVRRYGAFVAGSGITPVLSIAATALAVEPASTVDIVYGNRTSRSVMFAEELADLKDRYPTRLRVLHVLSREPGEAELLAGRLDAARIDRLLDTLLPVADIEEWFLCGPYGMVRAAKEVLARRAPAATVHTELFHAEPASTTSGDRDAAPATLTAATVGDRDAASTVVGDRDAASTTVAVAAARAAGAQAGPQDGPAAECAVTVLVDGRASRFTMRPDERVLDAALRVRPELPYACQGGVCSTCRAKVVAGEVTMARNFALEPDEVASGYVLTCQASPLSDRLILDYDA